MKSIFACLVAVLCLTVASVVSASGKKPAGKMSASEIDKLCKEEVMSGAQKEVDRQESQAKAAKNHGFSKSKALAQVKKDIYEGCVKSHK